MPGAGVDGLSMGVEGWMEWAGAGVDRLSMGGGGAAGAGGLNGEGGEGSRGASHLHQCG